MKNLAILLIVVVCACSSSTKKNNEKKQTQASDYKLELLWESDTTVRTPESVLLDQDRGILYVSNINEGPWEKDDNGFISKMDKHGKVVDLKWIEGMSAPKGMGLSGNSLFIADIDELVEADINTGEIKNRIFIEGNPQLNDISTGEKGEVYVSGSGSNKIYKLEDGELTVIFEGDEGERFNGLYWEKNRMLLITSASSQFKEITWAKMEAKIIAENMGHGDAIAPVGDGGYITTSWKGTINYVSAKGKVTELLNTEAIEENAADADFCIDEQILYVPTFFKNRVKAYKLVKTNK